MILKGSTEAWLKESVRMAAFEPFFFSPFLSFWLHATLSYNIHVPCLLLPCSRSVDNCFNVPVIGYTRGYFLTDRSNVRTLDDLKKKSVMGYHCLESSSILSRMGWGIRPVDLVSFKSSSTAALTWWWCGIWVFLDGIVNAAFNSP